MRSIRSWCVMEGCGLAVSARDTCCSRGRVLCSCDARASIDFKFDANMSMAVCVVLLNCVWCCRWVSTCALMYVWEDCRDFCLVSRSVCLASNRRRCSRTASGRGAASGMFDMQLSMQQMVDEQKNMLNNMIRGGYYAPKGPF